MNNLPFPWDAARGAPDLLTDQHLYEKAEQRIEWLCRHIGIRDIDEAKSRVLAKLAFATRRAARAAWALSDGAVLPLHFWHLEGLREVWRTQRRPPRLRKLGRDRVKAPLQLLWKQLESGATVTARQVLDAFAATGCYSASISKAMLEPQATRQLDKLPTSVLLAAALEEAEGASGDHGANPNLSFPDWTAFASYIDKEVRAHADAEDRPKQARPKAMTSSSSRIVGDPDVRNSRGPKGAGSAYSVWFATNRVRRPIPTGFTADRGNITYGRVIVYIPRAHRFGEIGSSLLRKLLRWDFRNDSLRVRCIVPLERAAFFDELAQVMRVAHDEHGASHALVYIHGYNVTFEDAAIRAAQLGYDLGVRGAVAFFSWPSQGKMGGYFKDEAMMEASEEDLTSFLADFAAQCGADKIHVVAHSMGNRGLLRALQRIVNRNNSTRFDQLLLAAPDVDRSLFLSLAKHYVACSRRTTLYASDADRAVHLSKVLHGAPRAGYFMPYTIVDGVDTIAVPDFDVDLLGHSYYAEAEAMLYDMARVLCDGTPPGQRQRLAPVTEGADALWRLRR